MLLADLLYIPDMFVASQKVCVYVLLVAGLLLWLVLTALQGEQDSYAESVLCCRRDSIVNPLNSVETLLGRRDIAWAACFRRLVGHVITVLAFRMQNGSYPGFFKKR